MIAENSRVSAYVCRRAIGTRTWMPSDAARLDDALSPSVSSACLTSSATSIVSAKPTSGEGSRSKSTKSGRSGLSIREYHAFRSMQPMFTIQSSASSSFTSGASIRSALPRLVPRRDDDRRRRDPVGHPLRRVLLEEELALPPVGVALHRERPVLEVRDEHRRDRVVVREQVALRDPLVRPEELVQVRRLEDALALADLGRRSARLLAPHLGPRALSSRRPL